MGKGLSQSKLRGIPSVEKLLQALGGCRLAASRCRWRGEARSSRAARSESDSRLRRCARPLRASLDALRLSRIQPVINGTGVVIHTNLGRSPLSPNVVETLSSIGC